MCWKKRPTTDSAAFQGDTVLTMRLSSWTMSSSLSYLVWTWMLILKVVGKDPSNTSYADTRRDQELTDEQVLLHKLRVNYDSAVRPVFDARRPVVIDLGITLTQIIDVDEKNQVLTTNVWLDQEWWDEKLKWNSSQFAGIEMLRIPCNLIWLPDIVLYNSVENHNKGYMQSLAMVQNTGRVFWPPIVRMRSSCKMDITYFPFDDQVCTLKLGSWAYDGLQVDVTNRTVNIDLTNYVDNGEWELIGTKIIRNVNYYPCCPEPFPDIVFYLHIRRRVLYYLLNVIIPCMLLSSLSLTGFLLPPDSGEKVTLGLTVLLAFSVFMLLVAENMPPTSEYIPLIGIYLTVIMAMSALSVALSVFVLNCHHRGSLLNRPPNLVRSFTRGAARVCCVHLRYLRYGPTSSRNPYCGSSSVPPPFSQQGYSFGPYADNGPGEMVGDHTPGSQSHLIGDSPLFWLRNASDNVTTSPIPANTNTTTATTPQTTSASPNNNTIDRFMEGAETSNGIAGGKQRSGSNRREARASKIEREIVHYLRSVLESHERSKVERVAVNEWQEVARVLDKVFFWLFVAITAISTLTLLIFWPMAKDVNVPET